MMNGIRQTLNMLVLLILLAGCGSGSGGDAPDTPAPRASVAPLVLDFGAATVGRSMTLDIVVSNDGTAVLNITDVALDPATAAEFAITGMPAGMTVAAGGSATLQLTYAPADEGSHTGTLHMDCDDPAHPRISIPLSGRGTLTDPPVATGYEGFGAVTRGAESSPAGYETYRVTSLEDSGPGTLRDALSQGGRMVVFDVPGTIVLESDLNIPYSYITVDGATAPSPGITIEQPGNIGTTIEARSSIGPAHDIIIRHLRMDGLATGHSNRGDIWGLDGESAAVYNIIIDHVTAIASTDGVFDIWEDVHDVTLSWNLIMDTVTACHFSTGDISAVRRRISIHHNVFARNNERQIRLRHDNQQIDFVNNVIYGWGWMEAGAAGLHLAHDDGETNPSLNVVNNYYHYVDGLNGTPDRAVIFERGAAEGSVHFSGNLLPAGEDNAVSTSGPLDIPASARITLHDAAELHGIVVPHAGMRYPSADERQLLAEIQAALQ